MKKHHLTLITGASRGLGLAMCQQLLAQGHCVVAISGQLDIPAQAATKVLALLARADYGHEPVTDVRSA